MQHWLLKSEPDVFSITDLENAPQQTTAWEGVRNYQARNFMQAMRLGDLGFFYHSNAKPPGIVGIVKIIKTAFPDPSAYDPKSQYYDAKSTPKNPRWFCVEVKLVCNFSQLIALPTLKAQAALQNMVLIHRGRLSVQPVTTTEWAHIENLYQTAIRHKS